MTIKFKTESGEYIDVTHLYPDGIPSHEMNEQEQLAWGRIIKYLRLHNVALSGKLLEDVVAGRYDDELHG